MCDIKIHNLFIFQSSVRDCPINRTLTDTLPLYSMMIYHFTVWKPRLSSPGHHAGRCPSSFCRWFWCWIIAFQYDFWLDFLTVCYQKVTRNYKNYKMHIQTVYFHVDLVQYVQVENLKISRNNDYARFVWYLL